jgi:hypothetical protein
LTAVLRDRMGAPTSTSERVAASDLQVIVLTSALDTAEAGLSRLDIHLEAVPLVVALFDGAPRSGTPVGRWNSANEYSTSSSACRTPARRHLATV